jgi:hypothetical protein
MVCEIATSMLAMDLPVPLLHVYRNRRMLHFVWHDNLRERSTISLWR